MAIFDDEVLSVVLRFTNPNRGDMLDADKVASRLSMSLDGVVRRSVAAGRSVGDVFEGIQRLDPVLKSLEKRAGNIGLVAGALRNAQQILARYTPARLEKLAEFAAAKIAETSGTASLRREIEKHGELIKRQIATGQGRYDRATRGSPIGRGLFIDTETTGLNALKHQVVELTATLFSFNKKTGEIVDAAEKTYHGFQQLAFQSRHQFLPTGLTAAALQSQAISSTSLRRLMQKADFIAAHNAPFDRKFVERLVPQVAAMPWMDTMRGIPWRQQGFRSRALQDLFRGYGIDPGQAHRTTSDVAGSIKLLGSRSPLGGPTNLSVLLGSHGQQNVAQQTLAIVKQAAEELRESLQGRIGGGRRFDPLSVRYREVFSTGAYQGSEGPEKFALHTIAAVENQLTARSRKPARSTDYGIKKGSGYSQESTPPQLGEVAISLDRRISVIDEFLRNMAVVSGPVAASRFLGMHVQSQRFQERIQESRGRGRQVKAEIRSGEEMALATMQGVNTRLENERLGVPYNMSAAIANERYHRGQGEQRAALVRQMLSQPWARPERAFVGEEVAGFVEKYRRNPASEAVRTAAQMASQVGARDPNFKTLTSILLGGQQVGRQEAAERAAEAEREVLSRSYGRAGGPRFRKIGLGSERGSTSMFGDFADYIASKIRSNSGTFAQQSRVLSPEERAGKEPFGIPFGGPGDLRGQLRYDALRRKIVRLEDSVDGAAKEFERYRDVIAQERASEALRRFQARDVGITQGLAGTQLSLGAQEARIRARRGQVGVVAGRKQAGIQASFEEKSATLARAELEAESGYDVALRRVESMKRRFAAVGGKSSFEGLSQVVKDQYAPRLDAMERPAKLRLMRTQFERQSSQLTMAGRELLAGQEGPMERLQALREGYATRAAYTRFGAGTSPVSYMGVQRQPAELREEYRQRLLETVGGRTPAQRAEERYSQVAADRAKAEEQLDQQLGQVRARRDMSEDRADQQRAQNKAKYGSTLFKIDDDVEKKVSDNIKKRMAAEKRAHELKVDYLKREDSIAGGGGGGRGAGIGGGRGLLGGAGASRSGLGFGLSLAALGAFDAGIKEVIKDSSIYAAKVQTMEFSTVQMAKASGLNVGQVLAEVEALKRRNITTQEANSVAQKMMLTQQDLAKAGNLVAVAQDLAALSGADAMQTIERLMTAITTGYTRNLHMMGLQVTMVSAMRGLTLERKAKGLSGPPTEVERREALVNQILQQGAKFTGVYEKSLQTAGGQFAYLSKEAKEASLVIGREFLPAFGHVVNVMTSGLQYVQHNGDAFAHMTSMLAALGVAANALGSIAFMRWMMGAAGPMPLPFKIAAVVAGMATYKVLNQDKAEAMAANKDVAIQKLREKIAELTTGSEQTRAAIVAAPAGQRDELSNLLKYQESSLTNAYKAIEDIERQHTDNLAQLYIERLDNQKQYFQKDQGFWDRMLHLRLPTVGKLPGKEKIGGGIPLGFGVGLVGEPLLGEGFTSGHVEIPGRNEAEQGAVKKRADEIRAELARLAGMPLHIRNQQAVEDASIANALADMSAKIAILDEKMFAAGGEALRKRFERGRQTPRERVEAERQIELYPIKSADKFVEFYRKRAAETLDPQKAAEYREQLEKALDVQANATSMTAEVNKDASEANRKLTDDRKAQTLQINEQVKVESIQAGVVVGNYMSEKRAILDVFNVKQQTARETLKLLEDQDKYLEQVSQNEVERDSALIRLDSEKRRADQSRREHLAQITGGFAAEEILRAPGQSPREAIQASFDAELLAAQKITDLEKKKGALLDIGVRRREALVRLSEDEAKLTAESNIARFEDQKSLEIELDQIINARRGGKSENQRAMDEIERTRKAKLEVARTTYEEQAALKPERGETKGQQLARLAEERTRTERQTNFQAATDAAKQAQQNVDAAMTRLSDTYHRQFDYAAQIASLMATSEIEAQSAAEQTHKLRLEYIEQEYEARKKADGDSFEAQKDHQKEIQQAEFEHLQVLLQLRRRDIEQLKGVAGTIFDALTTDTLHIGQNMARMMADQVRGIGRTIFQNLAVEYFKNIRQSVGGMVPGQVDASGKPTRLGRILSGTIFSPTADPAEIQRLLADVTSKNTDAEKDLTKAVQDLDDAIRAAYNLSSRVGGAPTGAYPSVLRLPQPTPPIPHSPFDITGIFGGGQQNNPLIFHLTSLDTTSTKLDYATVSNTTATDSNTRALNLLTVALSTGVISGRTGGNGSTGLGSIFGGGSTGGNNPFILFGTPSGGGGSGGGGGGSGGGGGAGGPFSSALGKKAAAVGLIAGGAFQAYQGFSHGGARNIASGIGGTLMSAAGGAALTGHPEIAAALLGAAIVSDVVASILPDPKVLRQNQITNYLSRNQYVGPVGINREMSVTGHLLSYNARTGLPMDTGLAAFPVPIQPNRVLMDPSTLGSLTPTYNYVPGTVLNQFTPDKTHKATVINVSISAIDTKNILDRSGDIAQAVRKELKAGTSDLSAGMQQSIFGAGF